MTTVAQIVSLRQNLPELALDTSLQISVVKRIKIFHWCDMYFCEEKMLILKYDKFVHKALWRPFSGTFSQTTYSSYGYSWPLADV